MRHTLTLTAATVLLLLLSLAACGRSANEWISLPSDDRLFTVGWEAKRVLFAREVRLEAPAIRGRFSHRAILTAGEITYDEAPTRRRGDVICVVAARGASEAPVLSAGTDLPLKIDELGDDPAQLPRFVFLGGELTGSGLSLTCGRHTAERGVGVLEPITNRAARAALGRIADVLVTRRP